MENPNENALQLFITIIGLSTAYYISVLANKQQLGTLIILMILISISIIVWFLSSIINQRILRISEEKIRKQYAFEEKIKGLWIERYVIDEKINIGYGLIEIIYEANSQTLHLKGNVYDSTGKAFANWASKTVYTDRNKKSIFYIYDGEFMDKRLSGNGYGKLDFSNSSNNSDIILSGTGCFEDDFTKFIPKNFDIDRLDKGLCQNLIGEYLPNHSFDKEKLIKKYHEYLQKNFGATENNA